MPEKPKNIEDKLRELKTQGKSIDDELELNLSDESKMFAINRILELDRPPYTELEKARKNKRAYQKLIQSTYYDSKPTYATRWVEERIENKKLEKRCEKAEYVLDVIEKLKAKPLKVYERALKYMNEEGQESQEKSDEPNEFEKLKALTLYESKPTQATKVFYEIMNMVALKGVLKGKSEEFIKDMEAIKRGKSSRHDSEDKSENNN